jgi:hypothetical protein
MPGQMRAMRLMKTESAMSHERCGERRPFTSHPGAHSNFPGSPPVLQVMQSVPCMWLAGMSLCILACKMKKQDSVSHPQKTAC